MNIRQFEQSIDNPFNLKKGRCYEGIFTLKA